MSEKNPNPSEQRHALIALNLIILSVMVTCFALMERILIRAIYPDWQSPGLLIIAFLVVFISLVVRQLMHEAYSSNQRPFPTALAELVLIILVVKLVSMFSKGFPAFWEEILSWQDAFVERFFEIDFLLSLICVLIVWALTLLFSESLVKLEEDKSVMAQERLGRVINNRQLARKQLINLILILGFIMMVFMVIIEGVQGLAQNNTVSTRQFLIILLVYFFSSFMFLAVNQYNIMKVRWYLNEVPVNADLARRWVLYSIAFIAAAVILVIFLPTNFTVGFIPLAQALYQAILFIWSAIEILFFLPFVLALSLFNSTETDESISQEIQETLLEYTSAPQEITSTVGWWEVLKSVLFWLVFLGVIIISIRYYLKNRKEFKSFLSKLRFGEWLRDFWRWIKTGFKRLGRTTANTLQQGIKAVQTYLQRERTKLNPIAELVRRLPPRQAVILTYINWVRWSQKQGIGRKGSQTPFEYAHVYRQELPEAAEAIDDLTGTFILARYTRHEINKEKVQTAQVSFDSIKEAYTLKQNDVASTA